MSKRRVTSASLHDGFFIPLQGNFKAQLPPDNKTLEAFEMYLLESGQVELTWIDKTKFRQTYVIGAANVKGVLLVPEKAIPAPAASQSKKS